MMCTRSDLRRDHGLKIALASLGLGAALTATTTASAQGQLERAPTKLQTVDPSLSKTETALLPVGVDVLRAGGSTVIGNAAEMQSAVVPPGKKSQCPEGRLLVSNDKYRYPPRVVRFGLNALDSPGDLATFDPLPVPGDQRILSNDHDLLVLNNGDVLLLKMGQAKTPLSPKPVWFDHTYKLSCGENASACSSAWGPGARSVIFVWRSEDCGETFALRSSIDMAKVNDGHGDASDGSGGLPQPMKYWPDGASIPPGSSAQPAWQMGGTDGPLAAVDRANNRVLYTLGVVGRIPDETADAFILSDGRVDRTAVAISTDRGNTWQDAISLPFRGWRTEVVSVAPNRLAFMPRGKTPCGADNCAVLYLTKIGRMRTPLTHKDSGEVLGLPIEKTWTSDIWKDDNKMVVVDNAESNITTNIASQRQIMRSPDSHGFLYVSPQKSDANGGFGYGLYYVDPAGAATPFQQISPTAPDGKGFILHLTAIDLGVGPILLYWYDINAGAGTMQVRGRLVTTDATHTPDFAISEPYPTPTSNKWFGDYHTAGGFAKGVSELVYQPSANVPSSQLSKSATFEYYPVWKHSDGQVHFARVKYTPPKTISDVDLKRPIEKARARRVIGPIQGLKIEIEPGEHEEDVR